jgi:uncharacterized protein YqhQ
LALVQAITLGIKAIEFSANKAFDDDTEQELGKWSITLTIAVAIALGIGLFILLPLYATKLLGMVVPAVASNSILFNLTDGIIRVGVFLLYIGLIGLWKDFARIFEYHGAEHKVIHAYENGMELTLDNVLKYSPLHPRCGTSFLLIVMVVSILVFSFIPQDWSFVYKFLFIPQDWSFVYKFLSRLLLIPVIAGCSYELLKLSSRFEHNPVMHMLIKPGLMLQRLTTREPDEAELEVALKALQEVLLLEEEHAR